MADEANRGKMTHWTGQECIEKMRMGEERLKLVKNYRRLDETRKDGALAHLANE